VIKKHMYNSVIMDIIRSTAYCAESVFKLVPHGLSKKKVLHLRGTVSDEGD
jgi:hypothetical protein